VGVAQYEFVLVFEVLRYCAFYGLAILLLQWKPEVKQMSEPKRKKVKWIFKEIQDQVGISV
jgi:hypothetical protein